MFRLEVLSKPFVTVSGFTLFSRILGFIRDLIIARIFGADSGVDAFLIAFKLPNLLRRLFVEGAFALGLVPILSEYQQHDVIELKLFIHKFIVTILSFLIPATIIGIIAAPVLVMILAPGFIHDPQRFWLTTTILQIILPYISLITLVACAGAVLQTFSNFWVAAFTPMLLNVSLIAAAIWANTILPQPPVMALAWGTLIAGIIQLIFQMPFLWRLGIFVQPNFTLQKLELRRLWQILGPALIGTSITQLNFVLDSLLLSFLPVGSISWLYYANRLMEFPQGVFGAALGTTILSSLSIYWVNNDTYNFSKTLDRALRWSILIGLPAAVGLWILAEPIIITLFQSERFTLQDVNMSAISLQAYAIGLPAYLIVKVLTPAYYARQDSNIPVRIATITGISNLILSFILMWPLAHVGLAWSNSITTSINAALLWYGLINKNIYLVANHWLSFLMRIGIATAIMGWCLELTATQNLMILILEGVAVYFISLFLLGLRTQHVLD